MLVEVLGKIEMYILYCILTVSFGLASGGLSLRANVEQVLILFKLNLPKTPHVKWAKYLHISKTALINIFRTTIDRRCRERELSRNSGVPGKVRKPLLNID